jgi:hypothetical protein
VPLQLLLRPSQAPDTARTGQRAPPSPSLPPALLVSTHTYTVLASPAAEAAPPQELHLEMHPPRYLLALAHNAHALGSLPLIAVDHGAMDPHANNIFTALSYP